MQSTSQYKLERKSIRGDKRTEFNTVEEAVDVLKKGSMCGATRVYRVAVAKVLEEVLRLRTECEMLHRQLEIATKPTNAGD